MLAAGSRPRSINDQQLPTASGHSPYRHRRSDRSPLVKPFGIVVSKINATVRADFHLFRGKTIEPTEPTSHGQVANSDPDSSVDRASLIKEHGMWHGMRRLAADVMRIFPLDAKAARPRRGFVIRSEEHTSELQSLRHLV